ncbi:MAG: hypothetical protein SGPRY_014312, partial [Prymnesium sp.]
MSITELIPSATTRKTPSCLSLSCMERFSAEALLKAWVSQVSSEILRTRKQVDKLAERTTTRWTSKSFPTMRGESDADDINGGDLTQTVELWMLWLSWMEMFAWPYRLSTQCSTGQADHAAALASSSALSVL